MILVCLIAIAVYSLALPESARASLAGVRPVFVAEFITFEAFAFSWLVKGERLRLLNDLD